MPLRPVDDRMGDTTEFPPVTVHETRIQSRSVSDYCAYAAAALMGLWTLTCVTLIVLMAIVSP